MMETSKQGVQGVQDICPVSLSPCLPELPKDYSYGIYTYFH